MPNEKTNADSLREYLTGAASDGGAQPSPNASLGNYRSSTEARSLTTVISNAIVGITIVYVSGGNDIGAGSLDAVDANTLRWKCSGCNYGNGVSIANGETKVIESDGHPDAYIRVTRTSANDLSGTSTLLLADAFGCVFALDDVSSAEAGSGDTEYRGTILVNESAVTLHAVKRWIGTLGTQQVSDASQLGSTGSGTITTTGSFATWPPCGWCRIEGSGTLREIVYYSSRTNTTLTVPSTGRARLGSTAAAGAGTDTLDAVPGIAIAIDSAGVTSGGAAIQTIADEGTAPTGVTWATGVLDIGVMTAGQQVGLWIKREIPADARATTEAFGLVNGSFETA